LRETVQIFVEGCTLPSKLTNLHSQWSFVGQSGTISYMKTRPTFKNIFNHNRRQKNPI